LLSSAVEVAALTPAAGASEGANDDTGIRVDIEVEAALPNGQYTVWVVKFAALSPDSDLGPDDPFVTPRGNRLVGFHDLGQKFGDDGDSENAFTVDGQGDGGIHAFDEGGELTGIPGFDRGPPFVGEAGDYEQDQARLPRVAEDLRTEDEIHLVGAYHYDDRVRGVSPEPWHVNRSAPSSPSTADRPPGARVPALQFLRFDVGVDAGLRQVPADPPAERVRDRLAVDRDRGFVLADRPVEDPVGRLVVLDAVAIAGALVVDPGGVPLTVPALLCGECGHPLSHVGPSRSPVMGVMPPGQLICSDRLRRGMFVGSRRMIVNPASGDGSHADYVHRLAETRGFDVVETGGAGDAVALAETAVADGITELAVCGGDGTVSEALRGLVAADALEDVTLGVVPSGTANLLAETVGIRDVDHLQPVVDVGFAGEAPFLVSCIAGLPADASVAASSDLKERFGTLAFLVTGAREALEFEGIDIELHADGGDGPIRWKGKALSVLVGNARRFIEGGGQADVEDGLFDVAVVERVPSGSAVAGALAYRILGRDSEAVEHFRASTVAIRSPDGEPITFSRDGELAEHESVSLRARSKALSLRVGEGYEPRPD